MVLGLIESVGSYAINICLSVGNFSIFVFEAIRVACTTRPKYSLIIEQMHQIGVKSFSITVLTGTFVGMVFALQSYVGFARFGGEQFIGLVVALGVIRELGPLMTGLMVTGRAGSAIAAEIATMQVTEQIDALRYSAHKCFPVSCCSTYFCRDHNISFFDAVCHDLWRCRWLCSLRACSYVEC